MEDFDIAPSKIGESAQRVVDRAIEESRRRDHAQVTNEHVFLAFAQVEWDTFSQVMSELDMKSCTRSRATSTHSARHRFATSAWRQRQSSC
jgi:ATP-dependent Clp protease ATP-binding subunit ClpA